MNNEEKEYLLHDVLTTLKLENRKKQLRFRAIFVIGMLLIVAILGSSTFMVANKIDSPAVTPKPEVVTEYVYIYRDPPITDNNTPLIEPEEIIEPRYGFTDDDIYLMTVLLCGSGKTDGDGEYDIDFGNADNHDQISLVLTVVMNRVMSDKFPSTVSEVIWQKGQFTPMKRWVNGLPTVSKDSYEVVRTWCERYDARDLSVMSIPETHLYFNQKGHGNASRENW